MPQRGWIRCTSPTINGSLDQLLLGTGKDQRVLSRELSAAVENRPWTGSGTQLSGRRAVLGWEFHGQDRMGSKTKLMSLPSQSRHVIRESVDTDTKSRLSLEYRSRTGLNHTNQPCNHTNQPRPIIHPSLHTPIHLGGSVIGCTIRSPIAPSSSGSIFNQRRT